MEAAEAKKQAVICWTVAPCGPSVPDLPPGSKPYFAELVERRRDYAPWISEALHYSSSRGLDVLDVGSGQGIDAYQYASSGARVVGIDLTPRHVELATLHLAASGLTAKFVEGDAESMPFPDDSFDIVSSNGVLHHTPDIEVALAECLRVLRPGGTLTVILYNRRSFYYWITQAFVNGILGGELRRSGSMSGVLSASVETGSTFGARPLVRAYSLGEVRRLLESAGFESVDIFKRHFRPGDVPVIHRLRLPKGVLDLLGRVGGWYVIGSGQKPIARSLDPSKTKVAPRG